MEIHRISDAVAEFDMGFLKRIYTDREISNYRNSIPSLAARFAAKEAVMKALGNGIDGLSLRDIEILCDSEGSPHITLYGKSREKCLQLGIKCFAVSLSHCDKYAVAFVAGEAHN